MKGPWKITQQSGLWASSRPHFMPPQEKEGLRDERAVLTAHGKCAGHFESKKNLPVLISKMINIESYNQHK